MTQAQLTQEDLEVIKDQLWLPNNNGETPIVYAILDGARDKKIEPLVRTGELKSSCLYEGKLTYAMAVSAPYIVRLEKHHPQTTEILLQGWGNSWGIFAITYPPATLAGVRRNCRKMAKVQSPNGKKLLFRYYDPRVLRVYLPHCNTEQAQKVFGPTTEYIIEGQSAKTIHRFRQTNHGVEDIQAYSGLSQLPAQPLKNTASIQPALLSTSELTITQQQISVFEKIKLTAFIKQMQEHVKSCFPSKVAQFTNDQALVDWLSNNIFQAHDLGLETEQEICRYLNVAMVQGQEIKDAPWLKDIMAKPLQASTKAALIEKKSFELLDEEHEHVKQQLTDIDNTLLRQFYTTQKDKINDFGIPLYGLKLGSEKEIKAWMYRVGQACLDLGVTDELAMDIWLDLAMQYGEHFYKEPWAQLTQEQKQLAPSKILKHLLAQQPHNHSAQSV